LVAYFSKLLDEDNISDFCEALDYDVTQFDDRAHLDELSISSVEVDGDTVTVQYDVAWSAYYGCSDMNQQDFDDREVFGEKDGDHWVFEVYKAPAKRSTFEEF